MAPTWSHFPYGVKMGDLTGPMLNHQTPAFTGICHVFFFHVASPFGPTPCEAVAKGDKLRHVRADLGFHVHHMVSIWGPSGSLRTQLKVWVPVGSTVGQVGPSWAPFWAAFGPARANFANSMRHAENAHSYHYFHRFFGFDGDSCEAMLPTLGLSWAQLWRQMPPHRTKLHTLSPTWGQTCPRTAFQLGTSWAEVGARSGSSWPNLTQAQPLLRAYGVETAHLDHVGPICKGASYRSLAHLQTPFCW